MNKKKNYISGVHFTPTESALTSMSMLRYALSLRIQKLEIDLTLGKISAGEFEAKKEQFINNFKGKISGEIRTTEDIERIKELAKKDLEEAIDYYRLQE